MFLFLDVTNFDFETLKRHFILRIRFSYLFFFEIWIHLLSVTRITKYSIEASDKTAIENRNLFSKW